MKYLLAILISSLTVSNSFAEIEYDPNYMMKSNNPNDAVAIYFTNFTKPASNYETFEYVFNSEIESHLQALEDDDRDEICRTIKSSYDLLLSNIIYVDRFNKSQTRKLQYKDYQDLLRGIVEEKINYDQVCNY